MSNDQTQTQNQEEVKDEVLNEEVVQEQVEETPTEEVEEEITLPKVNKKVVFAILLALILGLSAYFMRNLVVAATINGRPIFRYQVLQRLEEQSGKQMMEALINEALLMQEADKKNITVTQDDINAELKKIEETLSKQGIKLETALTSQNMTKAGLERNVKLQLLAKKLVEKDIKITQKQIDDYIKENKESFPATMKPAEVKEQVKQFLTEQETGKKIQEILTAVRKDAKIMEFVKY
jgi:foldase protein PrsA